MVSVVLPTYNGKKYIRKSIESVLNQTYRDLELIIVNDCSNDGTEVLVEEYALLDSRIRVIHNEVNKKLPGALNIGFSCAQGNLFTWTSDDNIYREDAIEKMVEFMHSNPEVDVVYADYDLINEEGTITGEVKHKKTDNIYRDNIVGACFLYKREVQETLGGYNEKLFLVEDYDFWLRANEKFVLKPMQETLYFYRLHNGSLTGTRMSEIAKATNDVLERILNHTDLKKEDRIILLQKITMTLYNCCYERRKFRYYMQLLKKESVDAYRGCGKKMILSQYLPKELLRN